MLALMVLIPLLGAFLCLCSAIGWSYFFRVAQWDVRLVLGLGVQGLIAFFCASIGLWGLPIMIILVGVGSALFLYGRRELVYPCVDEHTKWMLLLIALCTFIDAWSPVIDTDALYYHLALAKQMAIRGELLGGWLNPNGSRPMLLHMSYSLVYGLVGSKAPSLLYWLLSMALLISVSDRVKNSVWVLLLMVSSWSFIQELGVLSNNLPTAFALFLTWRMVCHAQYRIAACLAFVTLSFKLTALGAIFAIWLFFVKGWRHRFEVLLITSTLFLVWPIRNLLEGLHPLFPYMGWSEPFQHLDKYGMGREWYDFLWLPYNIFIYAQKDSYVFQGQLSLMLAVSIWGWLRSGRSTKLLLLLSFIFWAIGPQWLRHLMLLVPIYVYVVSREFQHRLFRTATFMAFLAGVPSNWGPMMIRWGEATKVITGEQSEIEYQKDNIVGYSALKWSNEKIPEDNCAVLVYVWGGALLDRPYVLSSVEDHIPVRSWVMEHGKQSLQKWPCDYIIVGRPALHRKSFRFLSDTEYKRLFETPLKQLEDLLQTQAHLIYTAQGVRVFRIEKKVDKI